MIGRARREAFRAAQEVYRTASKGGDLIDDLIDGFGVDIELEFDRDAVMKLMRIMGGQAGKVPFKIKAKIDPTVDM